MMPAEHREIIKKDCVFLIVDPDINGLYAKKVNKNYIFILVGRVNCRKPQYTILHEVAHHLLAIGKLKGDKHPEIVAEAYIEACLLI